LCCWNLQPRYGAVDVLGVCGRIVLPEQWAAGYNPMLCWSILEQWCKRVLQLPRGPVLGRWRACVHQLLCGAVPIPYRLDGLRELSSRELWRHAIFDNIVMHRHLRCGQLRNRWLGLLCGMRCRSIISACSRFLRHLPCGHVLDSWCELLHQLHRRHIFKCRVRIVH